MTTPAGEIAYDRLVAPGVDLAPEALPGFAEAAAVHARRGVAAAALRPSRGRVAVLVSACVQVSGRAAQITFLASRCSAGAGSRGGSAWTSTPEPQPMPAAGPAMGGRSGLLGSRGIASTRT